MNLVLKDCPFCGGHYVQQKSGSTVHSEYYVICNICRARTGSFMDPSSAVAAWNRRVTPLEYQFGSTRFSNTN